MASEPTQESEPVLAQDSELLDDYANRINRIFSSTKSGRGKFTVLTKAIGSLESCTEQVKNDRAFAILKAILYLNVENYQISADELLDLSNCAFAATKHFSNIVLSNTTQYCLDYMESRQDFDISTRWIEIFGKVVSVLSQRDDICFQDDDLNGHEFRTAVVNQLCRLNWGARNGPYLIAAMREFPGLDIANIASIHIKASTSLETLEPSSVPPIAYQLLLLSADRKPNELFEMFDKYFGELGFEDYTEDNGLTLQAKRSSLGTVVYHFIQKAPFVLSLSLGLTSVEHIKGKTMDHLSRSVLNSLEDAYNCDCSAWYKSARGEKTGTVFNCFKTIISSKSSELDFLLDGMKDFGIFLLNVNISHVSPYIVKKCQDLGSFVVESIVKRKSYYFPKVKNELLNTKPIVHINCLAQCLKPLVRTIAQSTMSGRINELIHHLPLMTVETATPRSLLDEMIMVVRKTIWKSTEARKISVQAIVLLLSNSRILGSIPGSQFSQSQPYSENTSNNNIMESRNDNECLCYELLSIIKRFYTQAVEVRERLYLGLNVVSRRNPELIGLICSHLQTQAQQHVFIEPESKKVSLNMDRLLSFEAGAAMKPAENLGLLIQSLSFVTIKGREDFALDSENKPDSLPLSETLLRNWIEMMSNVKLEDIEVGASSLLGNVNDAHEQRESVRFVRNALLIQFLQTIEALIEYVTLRKGGSNMAEKKQQIQALFKKYLEFKPHLTPSTTKEKQKEAPKKKSKSKEKGNGKKDKGNNSINDAASTTSQGSKAAKTKIKDEPPITLTLVHILNLETILEIAQTLYCDQEIQLLDSEISPIDVLRFEIILELIEYLCEESSVLSFPKLLSMINNQITDNPHLPETFKDFFDIWKSIVTTVTENRGEEILLVPMFAILNSICQYLTPDESDIALEVLEYCKLYAKNVKRGVTLSTDLCGLIVTTIATVSSRLAGPASEKSDQLLMTLVQLCRKQLGDVDWNEENDQREEDASDLEPYWLINEDTAEVVIGAVVQEIDKRLGLVSTIIKRLKVRSHYFPPANLYALRDQACLMLSVLVNLSTELISTTIPPGKCVDVLVSVVQKLFLTVTQMAEYLIEIHSKTKIEYTARKFSNLVKSIGKNFKSNIELFIHHVEQTQREERQKLLVDNKGKISASVKQKFAQDAKTIPAMVYYLALLSTT